MLLSLQLCPLLLQLLLQGFHRHSGSLIFLKKVPVIFVKLFHILHLIHHIGKALAGQKYFQIGGIALFIHKLNTELHILILLLLRGEGFLVLPRGFLNLFFLLPDFFFDNFHTGNGLHQGGVDFVDFSRHLVHVLLNGIRHAGSIVIFLLLLPLSRVRVLLLPLQLLLLSFQIGNRRSRYRLRRKNQHHK